MFCFFCVCDGMGEMEMGKIEWWGNIEWHHCKVRIQKRWRGYCVCWCGRCVRGWVGWIESQEKRARDLGGPGKKKRMQKCMWRGATKRMKWKVKGDNGVDVFGWFFFCVGAVVLGVKLKKNVILWRALGGLFYDVKTTTTCNRDGRNDQVVYHIGWWYIYYLNMTGVKGSFVFVWEVWGCGSFFLSLYFVICVVWVGCGGGCVWWFSDGVWIDLEFQFNSFCPEGLFWGVGDVEETVLVCVLTIDFGHMSGCGEELLVNKDIQCLFWG